MSLKQLGNYKMESKSAGSKREVRARRLLKKLRKNGSENNPITCISITKTMNIE